MALDDDGLGGPDEAGEEGQDSPDAEADAPEERFAEQREAPAAGEGGDGEQADEDADMADQDQPLEGAQASAVLEVGRRRLPVGPVEKPCGTESSFRSVFAQVRTPVSRLRGHSTR